MKTTEAGILTLVRDHAFWADEASRFKALGSEAYSRCENLDTAGEGSSFHSFGTPCLETVVNEYRSLKQDPYECIGFEEFYQERVVSDEVCCWCQKVREYKSQRVKARLRLGQIRSAITRIGRRLTTEGGTA